MDYEKLHESLDERLLLNNERVSEILEDTHGKIASLNSLADTDFRKRFTHVIFVRLSRHEKYLLEEEVFRAGYRDWVGEKEYAETELAEHSTHLIEKVARELFLKWSWADAVLRHLISELHQVTYPEWYDSDEEYNYNDDGGDDVDIVKSFSKKLSDRKDEIHLPGDRRSHRVHELLTDELNAHFFTKKRTRKEVWGLFFVLERENNIAVAPHPADLRTWRLLAYQVQKQHLLLRKWPGVHKAAFEAGQMEKEERRGEYPFYGDWYRELCRNEQVFPSASSSSIIGSPSYRHGSDSSSDESPSEKEDHLLEDIQRLYAVSDVWDVWILCRMLLCASVVDGFDQNPGTERLFWRFEKTENFKKHWKRKSRRQGLIGTYHSQKYDYLVSPWLAFKHSYPLSEPEDFIEFADYTDYDFRDIGDEKVTKELLEQLGFESNGSGAETWDLVYLEGSKRDLYRPVIGLSHFRHSLYLTDDMQEQYLSGYDYPGLCYPCDCKTDDVKRWDDVPYEKRQWNGHRDGHYQWNHPGGNVVFRRRKLEETSFCENLDRFWVDWNDCLLIMGSGRDGGWGIVDEDSIYLLETLPGIKARKLKEEGGDALARLFFNLKWHYRDSLHMQRDMLREIMGSRFRPEYADFTYFISPAEFDTHGAVILGRGSYGAAYKLPWTRQRHYDSSNGELSFTTGFAVLKIVAHNSNDSSSSDARSQVFCDKVGSRL
ncbi:hypothetical protein QBC46DRAFT_307304 [Diplogelasinospora grovesii]|uniref:Uncharacterized protein n=1 Tax=Diplogelasinospora grovesii TaxID=303347 RepID=A0AAN6S7W1_9PEZI|nr:hypothetical protein QBC46DRAFT_307304 [Diplogelasinospora grovesii]